MPQVRKLEARKDYPQFGIEKGQEHYVWSFYGSGSIRSLTPPKQSQLTSSDTLRTLLEVVEEIQAVDTDRLSIDDIRDWSERLETGQGMADEAFENLSEGLQQGPLGERLQQWSETADALRSTLEEVSNEWESLEELDAEELEEADTTFDELIDQVLQAAGEAVFE